jgi:hypothetical protein
MDRQACKAKQVFPDPLGPYNPINVCSGNPPFNHAFNPTSIKGKRDSSCIVVQGDTFFFFQMSCPVQNTTCTISSSPIQNCLNVTSTCALCNIGQTCQLNQQCIQLLPDRRWKSFISSERLNTTCETITWNCTTFNCWLNPKDMSLPSPESSENLSIGLLFLYLAIPMLIVLLALPCIILRIRRCFIIKRNPIVTMAEPAQMVQKTKMSLMASEGQVYSDFPPQYQ